MVQQLLGQLPSGTHAAGPVPFSADEAVNAKEKLLPAEDSVHDALLAVHAPAPIGRAILDILADVAADGC